MYFDVCLRKSWLWWYPCTDERHFRGERILLHRSNRTDYSTHLFRKLGQTVQMQKMRKSSDSLQLQWNRDWRWIEESSWFREIQPEPKTMKPVVHYFDETKCKGCQTCVQKCPTSAIDKDTYQIKKDLCVGCLRCEKVCPSGARSSDYEAVKNIWRTISVIQKK